jgi:hypothetical protein
MSSHQTEKLEIILLNEGEAFFRGTLFTYLQAAFGGGGGSLEKRKFVAHVFSSPKGAYNFASERFLQPITLESFDYWGVPIEEQSHYNLSLLHDALSWYTERIGSEPLVVMAC